MRGVRGEAQLFYAEKPGLINTVEMISMTSIIHIQNQNLPQQPYKITKEIFAALSPLDQIAAKALEKCGHVLIVDEPEGTSAR